MGNALLPGLDLWLCWGDPTYGKVLRLAADLDNEARALYEPSPAELHETVDEADPGEPYDWEQTVP